MTKISKEGGARLTKIRVEVQGGGGGGGCDMENSW